MTGGPIRRTWPESIRQYGAEVVHRLVILLFTLLTLFFLFRDGDALAGQLRGLSDRLIGRHGERIARAMIAAVHGQVAGLVLVGLGGGVLLRIVYVADGLPYPTTICVVSAGSAGIH